MAPLAGFDPTDPAQSEAIAEATLRPPLLALGAVIAESDVPGIDHLPRPDVPPTRGDAAAVLAAAMGTRPGDLARVTTPINAVTVLHPAVDPAGPNAADDPERYLPDSAVGAAVTAIGTLRPVDIYRLLGVRVTDGRGTGVAGPHRAGDLVCLTVDTAGTAWRGQPKDVTITVRRAGSNDVTLACPVRRADALTTQLWQVPDAVGHAEFSLFATIAHPTAGEQQLGPVRFAITITSDE
ncbi:hypothetical protein [Microlunatus sp. Gsoil 973]|uniref:hypothetical protein n=1 Tax=Microlunatus sp. Gsoil 973 TaxID=2672569 RepID=UPI0018A81A65|nr:hypothetical protein [Microlunatus sp. Gsoil 973]